MLIQSWLLVCALAGMILTRRAFTPRVRRWGYLALFAGQPAWIISALTARPFQWAVFVLVIIYTVVWADAAWTAWRAK